jgi:hypothetical protein
VRTSQPLLMLLQSKKELMTMTTNANTPAPNGAKKLPPMVKSIREFVDAMEFPPHERGPNRNIELAALVLAMLMHASGLKEGAETAACSPAQSQIAQLLHCSPSTVKRMMKRLRDLGFMTSVRRGDGLSSTITIHKKPQPVQPDQQLSHQQPDQRLSHLNKSSQTNSAIRQVNSEIQTGQLEGSDRSTPASARPTVDLLRVYSGDSQGKNAQDCSGQANPALTGSTVSAQESQESCRPVQPSPPSTGLIVKREGSEVPPAETCICCKKLRKKMVGGIVVRRGPNGYCQSHSSPDYETEA